MRGISSFFFFSFFPFLRMERADGGGENEPHGHNPRVYRELVHRTRFFIRDDDFAASCI